MTWEGDEAAKKVLEKGYYGRKPPVIDGLHLPADFIEANTRMEKAAGIHISQQKDVKPDDHMIGGTHYTDMEIQPWRVVDTWPQEQRIGFYRGNALKYVLRMGSKDESEQEIRKAAHYLLKLADVLGEK